MKVIILLFCIWTLVITLHTSYKVRDINNKLSEEPIGNIYRDLNKSFSCLNGEDPEFRSVEIYCSNSK